MPLKRAINEAYKTRQVRPPSWRRKDEISLLPFMIKGRFARSKPATSALTLF